MCLASKNRNNKPSIAEEDIEVYKVIKRSRNLQIYEYTHCEYFEKYTAPYRPEFEYNDLNGLYFERDFYKNQVLPWDEIKYGFHSFKNYSDAVKEKNEFDKYFKNNSGVEYEIVPCIIPKGTRYYEGYYYHVIECYCSEKIKLEY